MSRNWSSLRKKLEEDRLCPALRGHVQYFLTRYREAPDGYGRFAVRVDGEEWLHGGYLEVATKAPPRFQYPAELCGVYDEWEFVKSVEAYADELPIHEALVHENPIIRMFAVLDRRIGQRRLPEIAAALDDQPEWLRRFYQLRLDAEGCHCPARRDGQMHP